jgi:acetylglutamate kinase
MAMTYADSQAEVLSQALPYIQAFRGQTFVVKYGGSAMRDPGLMSGVIRNVILLQLVGIKVVLVHGGGPEIDRWLERLGMVTRTVRGLRVTDDETMEVVEMALAGRANKAIVAEIQQAGGKAVGLSGRDGGLILAKPISEELGRVGEVMSVTPELLAVTTDAGYIPVLCSVASDEDGGPLNVNADSAAAAVAVALGASKLILLTDTDGVLGDKSDPSTRISQLTREDARSMVTLGAADRGMIPKLQAAIDALEGGVGSVHLINGGLPNAILVEVFTDQGIGTMMR